jgi:hypothetical protein
MPPTRIDRGYLLVVEENLTDRIRLKGMLRWNPFKAIPEIRRFLPLPKIGCIFLESDSPTAVLAEKLRQSFPNVRFVLIPMHEVDGFLPDAAWEAMLGSDRPK